MRRPGPGPPLAILAALFAEASGNPFTCVQADNFLNAQYTVPVGVGTPEQYLNCVMDSGSFELLLSSAECIGCGKHRKFNRSLSTTLSSKQPDESITTIFGQGKVVSQPIYDRARVGNLTVGRQSMLLMQENGLRDFGDGAYDGIVGLGVSGLARETDPDLSLLSALGVDSFSICFGQYDNEPGRVEFGTPASGLDAEYSEFTVLGNDHWHIELSGVAVVAKDGTRTEIGGCSAEEGGCSAIVDSGTSLIAAPKEILNAAGGLLDAIGDVDPNCKGISQLPTIELTLGRGESARVVSLPPELYVANMEVEDEPVTTKLLAAHGPGLPHRVDRNATHSVRATSDPFNDFRQRLHAATWHAQLSLAAAADPSTQRASSVGAPRVSEACVALFMDMELQSDQPGKPWILGLPLMRAYKARFDRKARTVGLAKLPLGTKYCTSCDHMIIEPPTAVADFFPAASLTATPLRAKHTVQLALQPQHPPPPQHQHRTHASLASTHPHLRMSMRSLHLPSWAR